MDLVNRRLEKLEEYSNKRGESVSEYLRNILLLASSIFAIIVAFRADNLNDKTADLFVFSVCTLATCIIFGSIALYGSVYTARRSYKKMGKAIVDAIKNEDNKPKLISTPNLWIFIIAEGICYFAFILSVITLVIYTIKSTYS